VNVYFLGPDGTHSHLAAKEIFSNGFQYMPVTSIEEIFESVALSHSYYGVIPFENSYQGVINSSMNSLIDYDLKITKEFYFNVSHSLSSKNKRVEEVNKIISHPQVFGQCNDWLKMHYPNAERIIATSTAEAARQCSEDNSLFCIAHINAAEIFKLNVHFTNIQDRKNNITRFLVLGKMIEERGLQNKTSIKVNIKDQPGSLIRILMPFDKLHINMTRIETRPSRNNTYHHTFFIDFEGYYEDDNVMKLLEVLEKLCEEISVIGSYEVLNQSDSAKRI
tara:strand:- start:1017 stop:1850 length:834 start_codon:yes stop_codon:yes gene_type:complete